MQLDYDAPDRLIEEYAAALKKIHALVPRLSITALPGWSRSSTLHVFESSVDELLPMFYDFEPDPVVQGSAPLPLLVPEKLERSLMQWNHCQTPWRAGLPSFARVTLFDPSGKSRGHIRDWNWDDLCFNKSLATVRPTALGLTILEAAGRDAVDEYASESEPASRCALARSHRPEGSNQSGWENKRARSCFLSVGRFERAEWMVSSTARSSGCRAPLGLAENGNAAAPPIGE